MQIDEFLDLVRKRRSIRAFKPDPIPDEYVEKIIEAARWAMSGANGQPWEFIIVKDKDTRAKIVEICERGQKERWVIEQSRVEDLRHPGWKASIKPGKPGFKDAPVMIVVCGDTRTYQASAMPVHFLTDSDGGFGAVFIKNMANATHNIHLAAAALGIGSEWFTLNAAMGVHLRALLDVPDEIDMHTLIPIGYPAHTPPPPYRRELNEIMHFEKYDWSKYRTGADIHDFIRKLRQITDPAYARMWADKAKK